MVIVQIIKDVLVIQTLFFTIKFI